MGNESDEKRQSALDDIVSAATELATPKQQMAVFREQPEDRRKRAATRKMVRGLKALDIEIIKKHLPEAIVEFSESKAISVPSEDRIEFITNTVYHSAISSMDHAETYQVSLKLNSPGAPYELQQAQAELYSISYKLRDVELSKERNDFYTHIATETKLAKTARDIKKIALELVLYDKDMSMQDKNRFIERYSQKSLKRIRLAFEDSERNKRRESVEDLVAGAGKVMGVAGKILILPTTVRKYAERTKDKISKLTGKEKSNAKVHHDEDHIFLGAGLVLQLGVCVGFSLVTPVMLIPTAIYSASVAYEGGRGLARLGARRHEDARSFPVDELHQLKEYEGDE